METKKENKKGFWASLFAPKPCKCSCGDKIVEEVEGPATSCGCGGEDATSCGCRDKDTTSCGTEKPAIKDIKVLGPGCSKCKSAYKVVEKVVAENHVAATLTKVEDITEIMNYKIMTSPALVVDGVVKIKGRVPSEDEVKKALGL